MSRPVDAVIEFLQAQQTRGISHVYLDEGARDGLRELLRRNRNATTTAAPSARAPGGPAAAPAAAPPPAVAQQVVLVEGASKVDRLDSLRQQAATWQAARALGTLRDTLVFGVGNPEARLMLVGEAAGYEEEKKGEPFIGPAGRKLDDILKAMGLSREEVYLSNIVKFRPATPRQTTNNRKPSEAEIAACLPLVHGEIAVVRPACIVALGSTAAEALLGLGGPLSAMRGSWHAFEGIPLRVTYHPSYLLQSSAGPAIKRQVWEDMLMVMEELILPISAKQRGFFLPKA